jgi:hypothetical protein
MVSGWSSKVGRKVGEGEVVAAAGRRRQAGRKTSSGIVSVLVRPSARTLCVASSYCSTYSAWLLPVVQHSATVYWFWSHGL